MVFFLSPGFLGVSGHAAGPAGRSVLIWIQVPRAQWCLELAKLHTALAHVAATAQASEGREWARAAGPWFGQMSLALQEQGQT